MHDDDIDGAEVAALKQVEERAGLENGQTVLELGCGWGSLVSLTFPSSTCVDNDKCVSCECNVHVSVLCVPCTHHVPWE